MRNLRIKEINDDAVKIVKSVKILDQISWPSHIEKEFLQNINSGKKKKISFEYDTKDFIEEKLALNKLINKLSSENPLEVYTKSTIQSYISAIEMVHSVGSSYFQELSIKEYGVPHHKLFCSHFSHLDVAKKILAEYSEFEHPYLAESDETFTAMDLRKYFKKQCREIFKEDMPKFLIMEKMTAKASAGKSKVKIRKEATFSKYDFEQLLVHEVMTHTLTALNGSKQSVLSLMGQGAPRTTKTQEGLATFSEVVTGNMNLERLKRLALRIIAIDMALNGADFYDLFDFFKKHNQSDKESYLSSSRILRGGQADGGIVFTKDGTYLEGLIRVHSFFRWAFKTRNLDLTHLLFCGRVDVNDIFLLRESYKNKEIDHPVYLPNWYKDIDLLAGKMAFSIILNGIDLNAVSRHYSSKLILNEAA